MRKLKTILVSVYVILIILLLLSKCNGCSGTKEYGGGKHIREIILVEDTVDVINEDPVEHSEEVIDIAENIGNRGKLKVTLLWNFPADLDLHVVEPSGYEIYFNKKKDPATGGYLDVDNQRGGQGSAENIFWENPPSGQYEVYVRYYEKVGDVARKGTCQVVIFNGSDEPATYNVLMDEVKKKEFIARINVR